MTQNGNRRLIRYTSREIKGLGEYGTMFIEFGRDRQILPIAKSVASDLTDRLSTPVKVARFKESTRASGRGDYAAYHLEVEGKPNLSAVVQCSDTASDWARIDLAMEGYNPIQLLSQYARDNLRKVAKHAE